MNTFRTSFRRAEGGPSPSAWGTAPDLGRGLLSTTRIAWLVLALLGCWVRAEISVTDVSVEGRPAYRIATPSATWVYDREGAGFASLLDRDGRDWISYRPTGGAAGNYRGIPNAVHHHGQAGNNFFHPGHTGPQASRTTIAAQERARVVLRSESGDGRWSCEWEIRDDRAIFRLTRTPPDDPDYWFLYEGTPGGRFDGADLCVRKGATTPLAEKWEAPMNEISWVAFVSRAAKRALVFVAHEPSTAPVSYRPMQDAMTVFGFGRTLKNLDGQLTKPVTFTVALTTETEPAKLAAWAKSAAAGSP